MSNLIECFPVGPLQCNCSIIACPETKEAAIIYPGGDPEKILALVKKHGLTVKYLLHTHAHFDHFAGSRALREATKAEICLHKEDQWLYYNLVHQGKLFGFSFTDLDPSIASAQVSVDPCGVAAILGGCAVP